MNNKYVFAIVGVVVGLVVGYFAFSGGSAGLGAVTNYDSALQQQVLYSWQKDVATDLSSLQQFDLTIGVNTTTGKLNVATTSIATLLTSTTTTP